MKHVEQREKREETCQVVGSSRKLQCAIVQKKLFASSLTSLNVLL